MTFPSRSFLNGSMKTLWDLLRARRRDWRSLSEEAEKVLARDDLFSAVRWAEVKEGGEDCLAAEEEPVASGLEVDVCS